jgi:hypothetical protein
LAALSRRGDALSRGHTFAGPGIETPGNAFVGAGTVGEGLLGAPFGVRAPATLLLLLLETASGGGSSQEGSSRARLFIILQSQLLEEELMACGGEGEGLLPGDVVGDARVDLVEAAQEVEDEVRLRDGLPDVAQFVGLLLHANAVGVNGQVPLSHRVKLVIQEDGARSFVRLEHPADDRP